MFVEWTMPERPGKKQGWNKDTLGDPGIESYR